MVVYHFSWTLPCDPYNTSWVENQEEIMDLARNLELCIILFFQLAHACNII